jgi:YbbR domain-containing protein
MGFLRKYVFRNFSLKVFALAGAFALWYAIAREPVDEVAHTVPVEFTHVAADLAITSENVPSVQIWIRGPQRLVRQVNASDLHPTVNLQNVRIGYGERTFELASGAIHAPRGVEVVQVIPSQIHLSFDKRTTREVAVHPRVAGAPGEGMEIVSVAADPPTANITGPQKRVEQVEEILTDPVDATGVIGSATFTVSAYVTDPLVRVSNPAQVRVTVVAGQKSPSGAKKK